MLITFLEADEILTKTFVKQGDTFTTEPYPFAKNFTSHSIEIDNLSEFAEALVLQADQGHCLLKGNVGKQLTNESRAGSTDPNAATEWLCLDLDFGEGFNQNIAEFLSAIGITDTKAVWQKSASAGIKYKENSLRGHCFVRLQEPVAPNVLKTWLKDLNLTNATLRNLTRLTASARSLYWPLDITTNQNDKLIYIAPPILIEGEAVLDDPLNGDRVFELPGEHETWLFPGLRRPVANTQRDEEARIEELRQNEGIPTVKAKVKMMAGSDVLLNPEHAAITETKSARGYVYMNLNGGDSWAYYFPEGKPDIVYNFKGEPPMLLKALNYDFWKSQQPERGAAGDVAFYVFLDENHCNYYICEHDLETDIPQVIPVGSKEIVQNFRGLHGLSKELEIPPWTVVFDPTTTERIKSKEQWVNLYQPSIYANAIPRRNLTLESTPIISRVIRNVLANDETCVDAFVNWLAVAFQTRTKIGVAWLLQGVEGTGKGVLFSRVISPLFGDEYCISVGDECLREKFNEFRSRKLFILVDEINLEGAKNAETNAINKLKSLVTESDTSIRAMRSSPVKTQLYDNILLASNDKAPITISANDRRFNIGPRASKRLEIATEELDEGIPAELATFASFLAAHKADAKEARTLLQTEQRAALIDQAVNSADRYVIAILNGSLTELIGELKIKLPNAEGVLVQPPGIGEPIYQRFDAIIRQWHGEVAAKGYLFATKSQLADVFVYLRGDVMPPAKLNRFLMIAGFEFAQLTLADGKTKTPAMKIVVASIPDLPESPFKTNVTALKAA